ncbi:MAG: hypothetical protein IJZ39_04280 [Oscillospiraceae bacterium]|nr:hypothetical protein [Oscillospiraceae bacterium]
MKKESKPYSQIYLIVRVLAGGYLMYTAWNLREALPEQPLLIIAIAAFAVIGAVLAAHAGWKLYRGEYEGGPGLAKPADEETSESKEQAAAE